jgi:hypothetical protein
MDIVRFTRRCIGITLYRLGLDQGRQLSAVPQGRGNSQLGQLRLDRSSGEDAKNVIVHNK